MTSTVQPRSLVDFVRADGLQLIEVDDEQVVLKRGVHELLFKGDSVRTVVRPLVRQLDGTSTVEQIIASFPAELRDDAERVLAALRKRDLLVDDEPLPSNTPDALQQAFFANFGRAGRCAVDDLRSSTVAIHGVNEISRALARSLSESGVGSVAVVENRSLDNEFTDGAWTDERSELRGDGQLFRVGSDQPAGTAPLNAAIVCATSDFGETDALLDVNRAALHAGTPFLPVWVSGLAGWVGPLNRPFETACLRCYRIRADANDERHEISAALRTATTQDRAGRLAAGVLPPMLAVLGEIAAMEIVKAITGITPTDTVGRAIEVNLVSFNVAVRRVLKVPRCPDCSDVMRRGHRVATNGPQIPGR